MITVIIMKKTQVGIFKKHRWEYSVWEFIGRERGDFSGGSFPDTIFMVS